MKKTVRDPQIQETINQVTGQIKYPKRQDTDKFAGRTVGVVMPRIISEN